MNEGRLNDHQGVQAQYKAIYRKISCFVLLLKTILQNVGFFELEQDLGLIDLDLNIEKLEGSLFVAVGVVGLLVYIFDHFGLQFLLDIRVVL